MLPLLIAILALIAIAVYEARDQARNADKVRHEYPLRTWRRGL